MTNEIEIHGIVSINQKDVKILLEAGYLYMEMGKNKEAEDVFQGVATLIPHSEVPHMALGHLYFAMGRFHPALKAHQEASKLNPNSAPAHASVADSLFFLHKSKEALAEVKKAVELDPNGSAGAFASSLKEAYDLGVFG